MYAVSKGVRCGIALVPWHAAHKGISVRTPRFLPSSHGQRSLHQLSTCTVSRQRAARTRRPASIFASIVAPDASWATGLAVLLGYCVMAGSFFRSMPQIIKIVRRGTTEGLSMTSSVVELMCYSVILAYHYHHGYHPSTYCELVACWVQDVVLVALQCHYRRIPGAIVCVTAAAFMAMCVVLGWPGLVPPVLLAGLQLSTLFAMALGSRLPQIVLNVRRGNAGVLSLTTSALNVTGNIIRLFTNLTLTHDPLLLLGSCTQGVLNGVILSQVLRTRLAEHAKQGSGPAALGTFEEVADEVPAPANAHGTVGGRWLGAPT